MIPVPEGPHWSIDWATIERNPWVAPMRLAAQDPIHHGEGNVWPHTRLVAEALVNRPDWRRLPDDRRAATFYAAILHDSMKPKTETVEDGRIRHPGHSAKGAVFARGVLWRLGVPRAIREQACAIIHNHQTPFHFIDQPEWRQRLIAARTALSCEIEDVALHALADILGRVCADQASMVENSILYELAAKEITALHEGRIFPNAEARVRFFDAPEVRHLYEVPPDRTSEDFEVIVMSGLPGSGKSTVAARLARERDLPVVSMDALRVEMRIKPTDNQGEVIQAAQERLRVHLRRRQSCIWDSTNISRDQRRRVLSLARDYEARTHIVAVERSYAESRAGDHAAPDWVPDAAVERMIAKWEAPTLAECHALTLV